MLPFESACTPAYAELLVKVRKAGSGIEAVLIEPGPSRREDGHDAFGNPLSRLAFERPHEALRVSARLQVEVFAHAPAQLCAVRSDVPI